MSNISGRFMATHNGNGHWTVFDTSNGELLFNVTPIRYAGDLGQVADLPTFTTVEARDLIRVLTAAVDGIHAGGWEDPDAMPEGYRVIDLVSQAQEIIGQQGS